MKRNSQPLCGFLQEAADMNGRVSATGELFATQHFWHNFQLFALPPKQY